MLQGLRSDATPLLDSEQQMMHGVECQRTSATAQLRDSSTRDLARQLASHLSSTADQSESPSGSVTLRAVLARLRDGSGGAAATLASEQVLVRALFSTAAGLNEDSLLVICKLATWDMARDNFAAWLPREQQVSLLQQARGKGAAAINQAISLAQLAVTGSAPATGFGALGPNASLDQAKTSTGLVACALAAVSVPQPCPMTPHEVDAAVSLAARAIASKAEYIRLEMQRVPSSVPAGSPHRGMGSGWELGQIDGRLMVHESLTGLIHIALEPKNRYCMIKHQKCTARWHTCSRPTLTPMHSHTHVGKRCWLCDGPLKPCLSCGKGSQRRTSSPSPSCLESPLPTKRRSCVPRIWIWASGSCIHSQATSWLAVMEKMEGDCRLWHSKAWLSW